MGFFAFVPAPVALVTVLELLFVPEVFLVLLADVPAVDFAIAPAEFAVEVAGDAEATGAEDPWAEAAVGIGAGAMTVFWDRK